MYMYFNIEVIHMNIYIIRQIRAGFEVPYELVRTGLWRWSYQYSRGTNKNIKLAHDTHG